MQRITKLLCAILLIAPCYDALSEHSLFDLSLEELMQVTVTTRKQEEQLQRVPHSVTVLQGPDIMTANISSIEDIAPFAPALNYGQFGSDASLSMRGVINRQIEANGDPSFGFFIDEIYQPRTVHGIHPLVDIERIEIQRGPQGTLFGKNTVGGNISVMNRRPTSESRTEVSSVIGNYDHRRWQAIVNEPISKAANLRVVLMDEQHDAYAENTLAGRPGMFDLDQFYGRASLSLQPTEALSLLLRTTMWEVDDHGTGAFAFKVTGTMRDPVSGQRSLYGIPDYENPRVPLENREPNSRDPYSLRIDTEGRRNIDHRIFSLHAELELEGTKLTSITAYNDMDAFRLSDIDNTELALQIDSIDQHSKAFSQELRYSSDNGDRLQWVTGLYYLHEDLTEEYIFDVLTSDGIDYLRNRDATYASYAVFAQASLALSDEARVTAGSRYTVEDKDFLETDLWGSYPGEKTFRDETWHLGADYLVGNNHMLYTTASSAFKAGGFNGNVGASPNAEAFDSEKGIVYEIGSKKTTDDQRLQLNTALFLGLYRDMQVSTYDPVTRNTLFGNTARAKAWGAEVELTAKPVDNLYLRVMTSYLDARYEHFENATIYFEKERAEGTIFIDVSDEDMENSPDWKLLLSAAYEFGMGSLGSITPYIQTSWVDDYYNTYYKTALDRQESYSLTDASITWRSASKKWSVALFVANIEDEAVLNGAPYGGSNAQLATFSQPRTYGTRIAASF